MAKNDTGSEVELKNLSPGDQATTQEEPRYIGLPTCWKYIGIIAFVFLEVVMFFKGILLVAKYGLTFDLCENNTHEEDTKEDLGHMRIEHVVTVCIYLFISFLKFLEYFPFATSFWKYEHFKKRTRSCGSKYEAQGQDELEHNAEYITCCCNTISDLVGKTVTVKKEPFACNVIDAVAKVFSCCLSCFHWLVIIFSLLLLFLIGFAVPAVGIYLEHTSPYCPATTDVFYAYCCFLVISNLWDCSFRIGMIVATIQIKNIWRIDDQELKGKYELKGKAVKSIMKLYQSWFLIPWIVLFTVNALGVNNVLAPWSATSQNLPEIYLLLHNLYHVLQLLIAYACGFVMDSCHQRYYIEMKKGLSKTDFLQIAKEESYNFVPQILGKEIHLNSAVYVILLLMGTFLGVFRNISSIQL